MNAFRFTSPDNTTDDQNILMRFTFLKTTCFIVFITLILAGCSGIEKKAERTGCVTHIVLCWLKEPGNAAHRQKIIETSRSLRKIQGVIDVRAGEAVASDRPIVDDSFDVGMTFIFAGTDAMNAYLEHPLHKEALQKVLQPLVRKIVVYDYKE